MARFQVPNELDALTLLHVSDLIWFKIHLYKAGDNSSIIYPSTSNKLPKIGGISEIIDYKTLVSVYFGIIWIADIVAKGVDVEMSHGPIFNGRNWEHQVTCRYGQVNE